MSEIFLAPATFGHYSFQAIKLLDEYKKYVFLTTTFQKIIFYEMKSKQNYDVSQLDPLKRQINTLTDTYFDDHGKQHLKDLMNK